MQNKTKKLIIIICIVLAVLIALSAGVVAFVIYRNGKNANKAPLLNTLAPTASGDSVFNGSPNSSKNDTASDQSDTSSYLDTSSDDIQSDWSSEEDESSTPVRTENKPRVEKVIKTYPFEDEFYPPLYEKLIFNDTQTDKVLPYSLNLPKNYSKNKKYPVLLLLHGRGAQGTDHVSASTSFSTLFKYSGDLLSESIVVIPQTTGWWSAHEYGTDDGWLGVVMRMLYKIETTYSCDTDRVYIMGLSMGGYGTWSALQYYGDHFAAAVPICGGGDPYFASQLTDIPIWIYHGEKDDTVNIGQSEAMYNAIVQAGGKKIHFTRLPDVKHDSWLNAFRSRELLSWIYSQNKSSNKTGEFEYIPYFKVVDSAGETIITEFDSTGLALVNIDGKETLDFTLTDDGVKKLATAYKNSGGKNFNVYYGTQKLLTFKANQTPTDNLFVITDVFNSGNYYWYYKRISDLLMFE